MNAEQLNNELCKYLHTHGVSPGKIHLPREDMQRIKAESSLWQCGETPEGDRYMGIKVVKSDAFALTSIYKEV